MARAEIEGVGSSQAPSVRLFATSPNSHPGDGVRSYPDLIVHRWLWAVESRAEEARTELDSAELVGDLNDVAAHGSMMAELAEMAETAIGDLKICQLLEPHVGEKLAARIVRVSPPGHEVHLVDFNVSGFLPAREIGEKVVVKGPMILIKAGNRSFSFTEGRPIAVRLKDVDFVRLQVMLELA